MGQGESVITGKTFAFENVKTEEAKGSSNISNYQYLNKMIMPVNKIMRINNLNN